MSKTKVWEKSSGQRNRIFHLLKEHEGTFWEVRPDGKSVRYFPTDNRYPENGTDAGTTVPVEGYGTGTTVPSLIEGTGRYRVPPNPAIGTASSQSKEPVTALGGPVVCPVCLKWRLQRFTDGTKVCDFCGPEGNVN